MGKIMGAVATGLSMRRLGAAALAAGALISAGSAAQAQVTGVITHSSATVGFRPSPGNNGITIFNGEQLAGTLGSNAFGSGGSYSATSQLAQNFVEFENGNATGGSLAHITSITTVDITFRNDGETAVVPTLHSTITAAGMGIFNGSECLNNITSCTASANFPGAFRDFQSFGESNENKIAGAGFSFRILAGGKVIYELGGRVALVYDGLTDQNVVISDFGDASTRLNNFRLVSDPASQREYSFAWDQTDFEVGFPPGTLLLPGESSTLTYETVVTSFTETDCYTLLTGACMVAYSSFGDPIGRGGSVKPQARPALSALAAVDLPESDPIGFNAFKFDYPTYKDGILTFKLASAVPEPQTWAMMIAGFGLTGLMIRRNARRLGGSRRRVLA